MVAIPYGDTKDDNPSVTTEMILPPEGQSDKDKIIQALTEAVPPVESDPDKEALRRVTGRLLGEDMDLDNLEDLLSDSRGEILDDYYASMGFSDGNTSPHGMSQYLRIMGDDIAHFGKYKDRKTGFSNL
ncbi:MAG: hypothetical protein EOM02_13010, partial [Synergistales bacterium]|nr:hypothetical protein [Synergistales bacterium]